MELKAVYTVTEIANMAGISHHRTARLLRNGGVELVRTGRNYAIFLSSIQEAMPKLWESILQRAAVVEPERFAD
jgi:excisionase family DNA binding protein